MSLIVRAVVVFVLLALPVKAAAQSPPSFGQLSGKDGCIVATSETYYEDCGRAAALDTPLALILSPDDKQLYVVGTKGLVTFNRAADTGVLTFAGCVTDDGDDGRPGTEGLCADGDALNSPTDVAISPDGRFVYVSARLSGSVSWFTRDPETGALKQAGCLKDQPRADRCTRAGGLFWANELELSPDGRFLYVVGAAENSITTFRRDLETGALTEGGCVSDTGSDGRCTNVTALGGVYDLASAPDGSALYAVAESAVSAFSRNAETGELTQTGCLLSPAIDGGTCKAAPGIAGAADVAVTPDGAQLLVAGQSDDALSVLDRTSFAPVECFTDQEPQGDDKEQADEEDEDIDDEDEDEGEDARASDASSCHPANAMYATSAVTVSHDGRTVFTAGYYGEGFLAFSRNPQTGTLQPAGCVEDGEAYKSCAEVTGPASVRQIVATADGRNLYAATDGVLSFGSTVAVTSRAARVSRSGRVSVRLACPAARAHGCRGSVHAGAGRARGFHVARGRTAAVRLPLAAATRRRLKRHGHATVAVVARDGARVVRASTHRLRLRAT